MHPAFHAAELTTRFIDSHISDLICAEAKPDKVAFDLAAIAAARYGVENRRVPEQPLTSPWDDTSGWRIQGLAPTSVKLEWSDESFVMDVLMHPGESYSVISNLEDDEEDTVLFYRFLPAQDSRTFDVEVEGAEMNVTIVCSDEDIHVLYNGLQRTFKWNNPLRNTRKLEGAAGQLTAPMPGKVVSVKVSPGDKVRKGAPLVILEAMKMEHTITAPQDGTIKAVNANQGDQVNEKLELVSFE